MEHVSKIDGKAKMDNGPWYRATLTISRAMVDVTTANGKLVRDPSWEELDSAGHYHAWSSGGTLPTLTSRIEHVCALGPTHTRSDDEDEECDGYNKTTWHCRICGGTVVPGYIREYGAQFIPGLQSWRMDLEDVEPLADSGLVSPVGRVSAVFEAAGQEAWFGVAHVANVMVASHGFAVMLLGAGDLGQRG